jgi:hypothetical protein
MKELYVGEDEPVMLEAEKGHSLSETDASSEVSESYRRYYALSRYMTAVR